MSNNYLDGKMAEQERANQEALRKWAETGEAPSLRHNVEISESDRQLVLLALAKLALMRPGLNFATGQLSEKFSGREMFEHFKNTGLSS